MATDWFRTPHLPLSPPLPLSSYPYVDHTDLFYESKFCEMEKKERSFQEIIYIYVLKTQTKKSMMAFMCLDLIVHGRS